jgi:hypothetical protein
MRIMTDGVGGGDGSGGFFSRLGSSVGTITAVVGVVVAFNTAVTACTTERVARHNTFRDAVKAEETYWKGLYDDYLKTFDPTVMKDEPLRKAKRYAILNLANHIVPDFEEYAVNDGLKSEASERLVAIRSSLIDALQDSRASGPDIASASRNASYVADDADRLRQRGKAAPPVEQVEEEAVAAGAPGASLSYQTRLLATGDPKGWDIDVFWCQGPVEEANFAKAQAAAESLAGRAKAGERLAGQALGRVRLRSMPPAFQKRPGDPGRGDVVIWDDGAGEQPLAAAVLATINPPAGNAFHVVRSTARSRWYVGVFACPVPPAAPGAGPSPQIAARS